MAKSSLDGINPKQKFKSYAELARGRADIYRFFSGIYLKQPAKELVDKLTDEMFIAELGQLFNEASLALLKAFAREFDGNYDAVRQEFEELLLVPGPKYLTPYESVYLTGQMMQEPLVGVRCMHALAGAKQENPSFIAAAEDHIGIELDFLRVLCEREAKAWAEERESDARSFVEFEVDFLRQHLMKWLADFCSKMKELAKLDLYRSIAALTQEYVESDYKVAAGLLGKSA
jgi:TorA maturation chaperone TorD